MMQKTIICLGGLPRSASTLLCNIFCQNPDVHATHSSGLVDVLVTMRNQWERNVWHKAHPEPTEKLHRVLRAVIDAYYAEIDKPIIVDKNRGWPAYIELLEAITGEQAKVIVTVRDVKDILASFEKMHRKQIAERPTSGTMEFPAQMNTVEGRCSVWMSPGGLVGGPYATMKDAMDRGLDNRMCLVPFNALTMKPQDTMRRIYRFLSLPAFEHNFDNVEQVTEEDDKIHGWGPGLHAIRTRVEPVQSYWKEVLPLEAVARYDYLNFWIPRKTKDRQPQETKSQGTSGTEQKEEQAEPVLQEV